MYGNVAAMPSLHILMFMIWLVCVVAIDEEIIRGSDRRSGIEKYGQDDADAFLALDEQSGEDRGWKQFSIVQNPC